jgi:membrane protease YdiL (CAAX protease family)
MDNQIRKKQISLIVIGLFLIVLPFLINAYYYNFNLFYALWGIGVVLVISGVTYRNSFKDKKWQEEVELRRRLAKSKGQIIGYIGLIIFLTDVGFVAILSYLDRVTFPVTLFCLLFLVISLVLVFVSNIIVREEMRKERKKAMYGH